MHLSLLYLDMAQNFLYHFFFFLPSGHVSHDHLHLFSAKQSLGFEMGWTDEESFLPTRLERQDSCALWKVPRY